LYYNIVRASYYINGDMIFFILYRYITVI